MLFYCQGGSQNLIGGDTVKFTCVLGYFDEVWGFGAITCGEGSLFAAHCKR